MQYLQTIITEIAHLGAEYALLRFQGPEAMPAAPGQFAMVRGNWGTDPVLPRAFSLVEAGKIGAILLRVVGKGTTLLRSLRSGDPLSVLGPIGRGFSIPPKEIRPILVAGGVGVAPLIFLAEHLVELNRKPVFIYGGRTAADLPLAERLHGLCELILTTEDGSRGIHGRVTEPLRQLLAQGSDGQVYSCGPHPMLAAIFALTESANVACEVALEAPMACGKGTCKGCALPTPDGSFIYVCSEGPVFPAAAVFGQGRNP